MKLAWQRVAGLELKLCDPSRADLTPEERAGALAEPLFWAFAWPAGRVLAEHLLAHPELVRGRSVCDLGSGSGLVALAALRAGARRAVAFDRDPRALEACAENAERNGLRLELAGEPVEADLRLAADVLYEPANRALLGGACLVADCRGEPGEGFRLLGWHDSCPLPDLGFEAGFRRVGLWEAKRSATEPERPC